MGLRSHAPRRREGPGFSLDAQRLHRVGPDHGGGGGEGRRVWSTSLTTPRRGAVITGSAAVAQGKIFVGTQDYPPEATEFSPTLPGRLVALDSQTGRIVWVLEGPKQILGTPVVADGVVFAADYGGTVWGVDRDTGRPVKSVGGGIRLQEWPLPWPLGDSSSGSPLRPTPLRSSVSPGNASRGGCSLRWHAPPWGLPSTSSTCPVCGAPAGTRRGESDGRDPSGAAKGECGPRRVTPGRRGRRSPEEGVTRPATALALGTPPAPGQHPHPHHTERAGSVRARSRPRKEDRQEDAELGDPAPGRTPHGRVAAAASSPLPTDLLGIFSTRNCAHRDALCHLHPRTVIVRGRTGQASTPFSGPVRKLLGRYAASARERQVRAACPRPAAGESPDPAGRGAERERANLLIPAPTSGGAQETAKVHSSGPRHTRRGSQEWEGVDPALLRDIPRQPPRMATGG